MVPPLCRTDCSKRSFLLRIVPNRIIILYLLQCYTKLQKADFSRNDTWTSLQTNAEESLKIPLELFLIQDGRHHVTALKKN